MALLWLLVIITSCLNCCWANEPYCRQYEYDEKMLSKMIRTEIAMETLTKKLETMETSLEKRVTNIEKQNADDSVEAASIDGGWTDWSDWTGCTSSCGGGIQSRYRSCDKPARYLNVKMCDGAPTEYRACSEQPCDGEKSLAARDGGWTDWSDWTGCSSSCGGGIQSRYRSCDKPARYLNGKMCDGPPTEYRACSGLSCDGERSLAPEGIVPNRVGFTVKNPSSSLKNGALQFSTLLTNYGEDFNKDTGRFVCDVPGLYLFTATIISKTVTASYCSCWIHVGSTSKVLVFAHTKHTGDHPSGSGSLVYELTTGDEVYLGSCINYKNFNGNTHFSGVLIQ